MSMCVLTGIVFARIPLNQHGSDKKVTSTGEQQVNLFGDTNYATISCKEQL